MNALAFLNSLRPALPLSVEKPCCVMSNSELRRHCEQGSILINSERISPIEEIDFPIFSLIFFPKSRRKTTIV